MRTVYWTCSSSSGSESSPIVYLRKTPADSKTAPSAAEFQSQELIEGGERWYSSTAAVADLDGNGHLDLIIGNYFPDGSRLLDESAQGFESLHEFLSLASSPATAVVSDSSGLWAGHRDSIRRSDSTSRKV